MKRPKPMVEKKAFSEVENSCYIVIVKGLFENQIFQARMMFGINCIKDKITIFAYLYQPS